MEEARELMDWVAPSVPISMVPYADPRFVPSGIELPASPCYNGRMDKITLTVNGQNISNSPAIYEGVERSLRRPASQGPGIPVPELSGVLDVLITEETLNKLTRPHTPPTGSG